MAIRAAKRGIIRKILAPPTNLEPTFTPPMIPFKLGLNFESEYRPMRQVSQLSTEVWNLENSYRSKSRSLGLSLFHALII